MLIKQGQFKQLYLSWIIVSGECNNFVNNCHLVHVYMYVCGLDQMPNRHMNNPMRAFTVAHSIANAIIALLMMTLTYNELEHVQWKQRMTLLGVAD